MRILCVFSRHPLAGETNITKDLSNAFYKLGHSVDIVTILEKKHNEATKYGREDGCRVLRVRTGNMFDTVTRLEKFISVLRMPGQLYTGIKKYLAKEQYDIIITHTPFMANAFLIGRLKKLFKCKALLILWDIFPQNAVDLGMLKKGLLYRYLKHKEKHMLQSFDFINCMSEGNRKYLLDHYKFLDSKQLVVNYNWSEITPELSVDFAGIRDKYGYLVTDKICVFGGNIGRPQAIDNVIFLAKKLRGVKFLFIGKGTEFDRFARECVAMDNVQAVSYIGRSDYEELISVCDIGLVSLDARFTVPNFPSKTTDYLKCGLPIFALLDMVAASDYGKFLTYNHIGEFILAADVAQRYIDLEKMLKITASYRQNTRNFFVDKLDCCKVAEQFVSLFV